MKTPLELVRRSCFELDKHRWHVRRPPHPDLFKCNDVSGILRYCALSRARIRAGWSYVVSYWASGALYSRGRGSGCNQIYRLRLPERIRPGNPNRTGATEHR